MAGIRHNEGRSSLEHRRTVRAVIDPFGEDLVDPDLRPALAILPDLSGLSLASLPAIRDGLARTPPLDPPVGLSLETVTIPASGGAPAISGLLHRPAAAGPHAAILNLHGGGFVAGTAEREDGAMRMLSVALNAVILTIDYRLSPETPFPGALLDAVAALRWLHEQADILGIDPARIAVRGVSAGGGLAAGLALHARDHQGPAIAFLSLVYPMLDDRTGPHPIAGKYVWPIAANRFAWSCYLAGLDPVPAYAAPARAESFAGLPPTFIATGAIDLFAEEDISFAQALVRAGVPTELHVYPGAYHGFTLIGSAAVAQRFERDSLEAFQRALNAR